MSTVSLQKHGFFYGDFYLRKYLSHSSRGDCIICAKTPPTLPLVSYCEVGRWFLKMSDTLLSKGWEGMSFFDGEPEPFHLDRPGRNFNRLGNLFFRGTFDRAWRYYGWCARARQIFGR